MDNRIGVIFPGVALRNAQSRLMREHVVSVSNHTAMKTLFGTDRGEYEAGRVEC